MLIFTVNCGRATDLVFSAENGTAKFDLAINDGPPLTKLGTSTVQVGEWTYTVAANSISLLGLPLVLTPTVASPTSGDVTIWVRVANDGHDDIKPNHTAGETHSPMGWRLGTIPSGQFDDLMFTLMCV